MTNHLAALSPYLIPPALVGKKVANLGDGFILRAVERELGQSFSPERVFSPRVAPNSMACAAMAEARMVILAGANQLNDRYTVWPGLTADEMLRSNWRFVPFGVGVHGEPGFNEGMSQETKRVLEVMHERISFSSWRCPITVDYLRANLPDLGDRFLMTGCAVVYGRPLLEGQQFSEQDSSVAVTATERHDFWDRETAIIDAAARRFAGARKFFVVHQNFSPPTRFEALRHTLRRSRPESMPNRVEGLRAYARTKGFQIVTPADADACARFYEQVDVHVGTRLHAHLLFLSRNKRSWLVPVDGRSVGMAESLGFPLPAAQDLSRHWDMDFEPVRRNAQRMYTVMQKFTQSLGS
ncbi:hypothetical protein ACLBKS_01100 [Hylemonella sp. W303a]|uniref:hypothetical protein n=1 Tax=Hylemonella sp. W303a TaxID=3389873 RepID=UPI00396B44C1